MHFGPKSISRFVISISGRAHLGMSKGPKDPKLAYVSLIVSSLSLSPVNIIVAQQRRSLLSLLCIALTSTTVSILKMKPQKNHDSPWITLRGMFITALFSCIAIITTITFVVKVEHPAFTTQLPSYFHQSSVGNFTPSSVIRQIQPVLDSIFTFAQGLSDPVPQPRTKGYKVRSGPPDSFDIHKAAERCGWPDLHRWEITTDMFLNCLQGEERRFRDSTYSCE
jgi:hypothetical protein